MDQEDTAAVTAERGEAMEVTGVHHTTVLPRLERLLLRKAITVRRAPIAVNRPEAETLLHMAEAGITRRRADTGVSVAIFPQPLRLTLPS